MTIPPRRRQPSQPNVVLHSANETIDAVGDWERWTARLNCSPHELKAAIAAVGPQAVAVGIYLRGVKTGAKVMTPGPLPRSRR